MAGTVAVDAGAVRARRTVATRQTDADILVKQARLLNSVERALIDGVYARGMSAAAIANASARPPRQVQLRLQALLKRLRSPLFQFVADNLGEFHGDRAVIAFHVVLQGKTQRQAAAILGATLHVVRQELAAIRLLCEHAQRAEQRAEVTLSAAKLQ